MTVYAALAHHFTIGCDDVDLDAHLRDVLASLERRHVQPGTTRPGRYELHVADPSGPFTLRYDGEVVVASRDPTRPYAWLLHHVNTGAIAASRQLTLLHAAVACTDAGAVLLPGSMASGKSTLVAGLTVRGWRYASDEIGAIDPQDRTVRPYPRAISLDEGAWSLFRAFEPSVARSVGRFVPRQWQIPPASIGSTQRAPTLPCAVVLPRYEPGVQTALRELDPVEALRRLLQCSFTFPRQRGRDFRVLADVVDRAPCFELRVGDLDRACAALEATFGPGPERFVTGRSVMVTAPRPAG